MEYSRVDGDDRLSTNLDCWALARVSISLFYIWMRWLVCDQNNEIQELLYVLQLKCYPKIFLYYLRWFLLKKNKNPRKKKNGPITFNLPKNLYFLPWLIWICPDEKIRWTNPKRKSTRSLPVFSSDIYWTRATQRRQNTDSHDCRSCQLPSMDFSLHLLYSYCHFDNVWTSGEASSTSFIGISFISSPFKTFLRRTPTIWRVFIPTSEVDLKDGSVQVIKKDWSDYAQRTPPVAHPRRNGCL